MVCQCRIDERFLPVERFRCTATRKTVAIGIRLNDFRKQLGDCTQPEPVALVSSVQRLPQHKLPAVSVVAEIQPVIHFTPILGAFRNCRPGFPRVNTADYDVNSVKPAFRVESFRYALPVQTPEHVQPVGQNHRFMKTNLRLTERLADTVGWRDHIRVEQGDMKSFRM